MMVHCPHCDARAYLVDFGVICRPECPRCDRPLPMPPSRTGRSGGPMSTRPRLRPVTGHRLHA